MTEAQIGMAVLLGTSIAVSVVVHWRERRLVRGILVSSVIATFTFQVLTYLHAGNLDAFFAIALVVGGAVAACVAALVGGAFLLYRRARGENRGDRSS